MRPVLVADPEPAGRREIADSLRMAGFPVQEADDGRKALEFALATPPPAAAILEPALPGLSGYELCRRVKDGHGDSVPVIFVSGGRTESYDRVAGLLIGADDYLAKPLAADELVARVQTLVARAMRSASSHEFLNGHEGLTGRELEILRHLGDGRGQAEIAAHLVISSKTVANHIDRILKKLEVHSRAQAIAVAYRRGLLRA